MRLWDVASGRPVGFRVQMLPDGAWACLDAAGERVIRVHGDAWRWLGWLAPDAKGVMTRWPLEVFGRVPEAGES